MIVYRDATTSRLTVPAPDTAPRITFSIPPAESKLRMATASSVYDEQRLLSAFGE